MRQFVCNVTLERNRNVSDSTRHRHHLLLRRLQSLTGIVPIGVFLIAHLTTNSTILWGAFNSRGGDDAFSRRVGTFQEEVSWIYSMPGLLLIEIILWTSIAFHAILGMAYIHTGKSNLRQYKNADNARYTLQRISGYIGFLFIFYHIATLRWGWTFLIPGGTQWTHEFAGSTLAAALQGGTEGFTVMGIAVSLFYFVGVSMLVFHFANGLWTAAITWGLTVSVGAQRRWGQVCAGLGVGMMLMAWASIIGFATLDYEKAQQVEAGTYETEPAQIHADIRN